MNRKKIVAGNWKMNLNLNEAKNLVSSALSEKSLDTSVEKIFFPAFPFISEVVRLSNNHVGFEVGAQNCSAHSKGAFSGEVSASMIKSVGCNWVIIGHSERRIYFNENNDELVSKMKMAFENNLKVMFCFGEQLHERKNNLHFETVEKQLKEVLKHFPDISSDKIALAYEPVWAIGTGETATPAQAQEMHAHIRKFLSEIISEEFALSVSLLYGGSCNAQNAKELFHCADVDGGLIGGASLKAEDFCAIINSF